MRILVFILALLASIACGGIGFLLFVGITTFKSSPEVRFSLQVADRLSQLDEQALLQEISKLSDKQLQQELVKADLKQLRLVLGLFRALEFTTYSLGGACLLGLIGGIFALMRKKWIAIILFLACVGTPAYFALPFREVKLEAIAADGAKQEAKVDFKIFFLMVCGSVAPFGLCALLSLLIGAAPSKRRKLEDDEELEAEPPVLRGVRRAPPVEGGEEPSFEDDAPPPRRQSQAIQSESPEDVFDSPPPAAIQAEPPPPPPVGPVVARFPCPKCGMGLKKTNPEAGKPIKCPQVCHDLSHPGEGS